MENVTVKILQTYDGVNGVDLGLINQAKEELNWDQVLQEVQTIYQV